METLGFHTKSMQELCADKIKQQDNELKNDETRGALL
jgi:hypothetical protein